MSSKIIITAPEELKPDKNGKERPDERFHAEREKLRYHEDVCLYYIRVGLLVFGSILAFGVVAVYIWHLVGPVKWRWLDVKDHSLLKDTAMAIIVGLSMSSLTSYFFKKTK